MSGAIRLGLLMIVTLAPACGGGGGAGGGASGPVVASVNPGAVCVGEEIQVGGSGSGSVQGGSSLTVSGIPASIVAWSDIQIRAIVPAAVSSGAVRVTVAGASSNAGYVVVLWSPAVQPIPICTAAGSQMNVQIASDGAGGAILVWTDPRNDVVGDIYAQRVDSSGAPQWAADGIPVCVAVAEQSVPIIIPDGSGGAIILWSDYRNLDSDIYAQRVNSAGVGQWAANGVPICTAPDSQDGYQMVPDGSGGVIIVWGDYRSGTNLDIYAQRVNGAGAPQWTVDGVPLCATFPSQQNPQIASDGAGGAIVVWEESVVGGYDLYAQRVNGGGNVQWAVNGLPICTAPESQGGAQIVSDGSGGAILVWVDFRDVVTSKIFAQRIDGVGAIQWTPNGKSVCPAIAGSALRAISDGAGGAIIVWAGTPDGSELDTYAQRIDGAGTLLWATDGVVVCGAAGGQTDLEVVSGGAGDIIILWTDQRSGSLLELYAQRVRATGAVVWAADGVAVRTDPTSTGYLPSIVSDGAGGIIVVWVDAHGGTESHVEVQGITPGPLP